MPGEEQQRGSGLLPKYIMIGVGMGIFLILGSVLLTNKDSGKENKQKENAVTALEYDNDQQSAETKDGVTSDGAAVEGQKPPIELSETTASGSMNSKMQEINKLYQENKLRSSDLEFWDTYPPGQPELIKESELDKNKDESENENSTDGENSKDTEKDKTESEESDPSLDGKHTLLTLADGTEEWVLLNPYLEQNTYDFTKLTMKADKMTYSVDGKKYSHLGVDISKYNGEVNFTNLKAAGIEFVIIRLGSRGYGSGQVILDEKFVDNMTKAAEAGLEIGVYFFSQAITPEEAVEEANFVIQNLANYKITYPVAFDMEYVKNDTARIDGLKREEKTALAKTFLDTVKTAGYKPMIYGTKEWLIKEIDLTKLTDYDIWLSQQKDVPDYPYKFQMWQYSLKGKVDGITGDVDLNISFVDYSEK